MTKYCFLLTKKWIHDIDVIDFIKGGKYEEEIFDSVYCCSVADVFPFFRVR
jgi:hypothetical protein